MLSNNVELVTSGYAISVETAALGRIGERYVMRDSKGHLIGLPVATETDHLREVWTAFLQAAGKQRADAHRAVRGDGPVAFPRRLIHGRLLRCRGVSLRTIVGASTRGINLICGLGVELALRRSVVSRAACECRSRSTVALLRDIGGRSKCPDHEDAEQERRRRKRTPGSVYPEPGAKVGRRAMAIATAHEGLPGNSHHSGTRNVRPIAPRPPSHEALQRSSLQNVTIPWCRVNR
jgi:hypothetical protein